MNEEIEKTLTLAIIKGFKCANAISTEHKITELCSKTGLRSIYGHLRNFYIKTNCVADFMAKNLKFDIESYFSTKYPVFKYQDTTFTIHFQNDFKNGKIKLPDYVKLKLNNNKKVLPLFEEPNIKHYVLIYKGNFDLNYISFNNAFIENNQIVIEEFKKIDINSFLKEKEEVEIKNPSFSFKDVVENENFNEAKKMLENSFNKAIANYV